MDEAATDGAPDPFGLRARHIKKRALKNKSLFVSFNEKDLKDYVCGFHKRKKKRRKEALQKQEEAERRKLIDRRKKRKLEGEFVMSGGGLIQAWMLLNLKGNMNLMRIVNQLDQFLVHSLFVPTNILLGLQKMKALLVFCFFALQCEILT